MIICSFGGYEPTVNYCTQQERVEDMTIHVGNCWSYTPELRSGTLICRISRHFNPGTRELKGINKFVLNFNTNAENTKV